MCPANIDYCTWQIASIANSQIAYTAKFFLTNIDNIMPIPISSVLIPIGSYWQIYRFIRTIQMFFFITKFTTYVSQ
jgi:hypothetical protein